MSHLTTYNSKVLDNCKMFILNLAVEDLGLGLDSNIKKVENYYVETAVDAAFTRNGSPLSLGIKFDGNKLNVVGDFYDLDIDEDTFVDKLAQAYKKYDVMYQCRQMGWTINHNDITIDNKTDEIVIKASRFTA